MTITLIVIIVCLLIYILYISHQTYIKNETDIQESADRYIAMTIQKGVLPKDNEVEVKGYDICGHMNAVESVGGDYYDIRSFGGSLWVFLGDVTGHGFSAAMISVMVQSMINSICKYAEYIGHQISPAQVNYILNQSLIDNLRRADQSHVMTIATICLTNDYLVVSGSHEDFYIYRYRNDEVECISLQDFPIGIGFDDLNIKDISEHIYDFHHDDILFIVTDGIIEAPYQGDYRKGLYGHDRLINFILENINFELATIKENLILDIAEFTHESYKDDLCFIIIKKEAEHEY